MIVPGVGVGVSNIRYCAIIFNINALNLCEARIARQRPGSNNPVYARHLFKIL
jgi:hypothetical protein